MVGREALEKVGRLKVSEKKKKVYLGSGQKKDTGKRKRES